MSDDAPQLLLVDDDKDLAAMLQEYLVLQGFKVRVAASGEEALEQVGDALPDIVVLDVMLPGISGFDVLQKLRQSHDLPVIMLTARGEEPDRILGLMQGADDYLPKPFNPLELTARIKAILKRASRQEAPEQSQLTVGPLTLDVARCQLTVNKHEIKVTAAEMGVAEQLLRHPDEVLSRARLTERVLKRELEPYDRSIDTLISKLRSKLAEAGIARDAIKALRGHGYVLDREALEQS